MHHGSDVLSELGIQSGQGMPLWLLITLCAVGGVLLLIILIGTFFTVDQQTVAVIERFGKFVRLAQAGLNFKVPLIESVVDQVSLRIEQLDVEVETKTKDNVFVRMKVSVQHFVMPNKVYEAYYKLNRADQQIESYVFDVVRARVPKLRLDDVFENKDDIADAVKAELTETMDDFGYGITKALVTDIDPDQKVKDSMNEINAAERLRVAAQEKGEAEKILKVKAAEAEAESKKLQGEGIANQRKAIADGLRESIEAVKSGVPDVDAEEVLKILLVTQYFDALESIGKNANTNTIMLPHSPGGLAGVMDQVRDMLVASAKAASAPSAPGTPKKGDMFGLSGGTDKNA